MKGQLYLDPCVFPCIGSWYHEAFTARTLYAASFVSKQRVMGMSSRRGWARRAGRVSLPPPAVAVIGVMARSADSKSGRVLASHTHACYVRQEQYTLCGACIQCEIQRMSYAVLTV